MKKVVIYPGRFQPMLPHHAEVYKKLQAQFPDADVYVATSDKVEMPKSPFNFKEKVEIMTQMHDIPADKIIQAKVPYLVDSYTKAFDQENTMVIFAVGEKDTDRFPMSNLDPETGLDMKVRGEPGPKFYQMINTLEKHPALPMSQRGYIYQAPNIDKGDVVASASAFRNAFNSATDNEHKKEIFVKYMGTFNQGIFDLLKSKAEKKMSEELNIMKYLAGMLQEAPMDYSDNDDRDIDDTDDDGYKPGFAQKNMITQLGKVADSEDASKDAEVMKVKKFDKITSVTTDDGDTHEVSGAEADALIKMFNMLSSQRAGEEESPREKFNRTIQKSQGLTQMLDFAKAKGLVKEESAELPTLDLADIRSDYQPELEEGGDCYHCDGKDPDCEHCSGDGYVKFDDDPQEPSQEEMDKHAKKGTVKHKGKAFEELRDIKIDSTEHEIVVKVGDDKSYTLFIDGKKVGEYSSFGQAKKVVKDKKKKEEMDKHAKKESAPFGEPSQDDQMYQDMMDAYEKGGEPALAKHLGMSDQELDQEMTEWAMDHNLHMDDDRDDVIQGYIEDVINNRDIKDYGSAMSESKNCGCNQDPCITYGKKESNEDLEILKKLAGLN